MQVRVDINKVEIVQTEQINSGEYNTRKIQFNIAENMQGLILKALFTKDYKTYEADIENDSCMIPWEALECNGNCELGVYAYSVNGEVLEIRYSPEPTKFYINAGSYKTEVENGEQPTPTRSEVLEGKIKELDNKKVDKENGKGLSTNDFTNELKDKLDNAGKQEDIDKLKAENQEQAEQINYLDKTLTRAEASGENINIKNSAEYPISNISIDTNIKQDSRVGYNLVDIQNFSYSTNVNKVEVTPEYLILEQVDMNSLSTIRVGSMNLKAGVTYTIKRIVEKLSGSTNDADIGNIELYLGTKWKKVLIAPNVTTSKTFTVEEDGVYSLALKVAQNNVSSFTDKVKVKFSELMVYEGTENKPYEQYGSMPSIEFPSEIKTPVGKQSLVSANKNIFMPTLKNDNTTINCTGATVSLIDDEYIFVSKAKDFYFGQVANVNNSYEKHRGVLYNTNGKSKIYFLITNTLLKNNYISFYDKDKIPLGYQLGYGSQGSVDIPENAEYFSFRFGYANSIVGETYKTKVMLSFEEITEYVKHQSQVQDLDLTSELLGPIVDKEDGSYFENRYEKYIFTGEEGMIKSSITTLDRYVVNINVENFVKGSGPKSNLCNYFKSGLGNIGYMGTDDNGDSGKQRAIFEYAETGTTTLDDFKAKLRELYASGNPVKLLYPLATPTYTKLTSEQQAQWNKIKKMHTYEGVTNIYTINENGISPVINMKYVKSPKVVEENLQAQIDKLKNSIISMGGNV